METENVYKQFEIFWKCYGLWCIENASINIESKMSFLRFCVKIPVFPYFLFCFSRRFWKLTLLLTPQVPSRFTFLSEKILLKKIYAFVLTLKVMTDTKKLKKKHILYHTIMMIIKKALKKQKIILIIIKIIWMFGINSI